MFTMIVTGVRHVHHLHHGGRRAVRRRQHDVRHDRGCTRRDRDAARARLRRSRSCSRSSSSRSSSRCSAGWIGCLPALPINGIIVEHDELRRSASRRSSSRSRRRCCSPGCVLGAARTARRLLPARCTRRAARWSAEAARRLIAEAHTSSRTSTALRRPSPVAGGSAVRAIRQHTAFRATLRPRFSRHSKHEAPV